MFAAVLVVMFTTGLESFGQKYTSCKLLIQEMFTDLVDVNHYVAISF